jgi:dihydroxy-acid dehydratase
MGTASTMACVAETLGMTIPGTAAIPAVHADRLRAAEASGLAAARMVEKPILPSEIITEKSVENAIRVLLALSGSTNAIVHLTAVAGRLGINVSLERLNELSDTTPVLVNLKPMGSHYMEDFFFAGGMGAVLRELRPLLHLDTISVTGETLGDRLETDDGYIDTRVIARAQEPLEPEGGLIALFGNLAPNGAIFKRAAADKNLFEAEGRAVVFSSLEDLAARVDDPDLDISSDDFMVLQNAGPKSDSGMPEAGYLPIPKKLSKLGVKDMVRISDARMSGTAFGTIVLHVSPEAAIGGPLSLVRNGDRIRISVSNKRIDLLVDEKELDKRRSEWVSDLEEPENLRGYNKLYATEVTQAEQGCDFEFLKPVKR